MQFLVRLLKGIEKAGNALPHPAILFFVLAFVVVLMSWFASIFGLSAPHPATQEMVIPENLLSISGLHYLLTHMVKNFSSFAPLGTVLVLMLGFSLAEKSGLISTMLRLLVLRAPKQWVTPAIFMAGVLSHTASDIGYVILVPLAAMIFHSIGRHPLAGLAAGFAGVSGGFAANFILSAADPLLAGISQEAARIVDPNYIVTPVVNWYFMATSSFLIVGIGTWVTHKIIIPYLGPYKGNVEKESLDRLTKKERRGLWVTGFVFLALIGLIVWGAYPEDGFLRNSKTGGLLNSPLLHGTVALIFLVGASCGLTFGLVTRSFKNEGDIVNAMQDVMVTMAPYIVLVFFASQFIALFNHSNMGLILAVHGSDFLKTQGLDGPLLMIGFIFLTIVLDLFIGSASAKWVLMAPIFVPMFMILGYAPELTQASYRIGDSVVNIISPLMVYFPLILSFAQKYDSRARVGTVVSMMIPYSVSFMIFWSSLLFLWMTLEWPLGPGAQLWYVLPTPGTTP